MNSDKLADMTVEERLAEFERMVDLRYGGQKAKTARLAHDLGVSEVTISNWRRKPKSIPFMALVLLYAWTEETEREAVAASLAEITDGLERISKAIARISRIADRL